MQKDLHRVRSSNWRDFNLSQWGAFITSEWMVYSLLMVQKCSPCFEKEMKVSSFLVLAIHNRGLFWSDLYGCSQFHYTYPDPSGRWYHPLRKTLASLIQSGKTRTLPHVKTKTTDKKCKKIKVITNQRQAEVDIWSSSVIIYLYGLKGSYVATSLKSIPWWTGHGEQSSNSPAECSDITVKHNLSIFMFKNSIPFILVEFI